MSDPKPAFDVEAKARVLDEGTCEKCGRENIIWFTENPLWNSCATDADGKEWHFLCSMCFVRIAEAKGLVKVKVWRLVPELVDRDMHLAELTAAHEAGKREGRVEGMRECEAELHQKVTTVGPSEFLRAFKVVAALVAKEESRG